MRSLIKTAAICAILGIAANGCRRQVVVVSGPPDVVLMDDAPVWDGHVWITIHHHHHEPGCGHYYHHGAWHAYPSDYVYYEAGYAPFGIYVDYSREPDRVWTGGSWIIVSGHHHGPGCGHFYHHGAWHLYAEDHHYSRPEEGHFGTRIEPVHRERVTPTPDRPHPPDPPRKPEPPERPKPPPEKPKKPYPPDHPEPPRKPDRPK